MHWITTHKAREPGRGEGSEREWKDQGQKCIFHHCTLFEPSRKKCPQKTLKLKQKISYSETPFPACKERSTFIYDQAFLGGLTYTLGLRTKALRKSKQRNLNRSPYLHSIMSRSNCQYVSRSRCLSFAIQDCHRTKYGGHGSSGQEFMMGQQLGPTQRDSDYCVWKGTFSVSSQPWRSGIINANISALHRAEVVHYLPIDTIKQS